MRLFFVICFVLSLIGPLPVGGAAPESVGKNAIAALELSDLDCAEHGHLPTDTDRGFLHHELHCSAHAQAPVRIIATPAPSTVATIVNWRLDDERSPSPRAYRLDRPPQPALSPVI